MNPRPAGFWLVNGALWLLAVATLAPFAWMLLASVSPAGSTGGGQGAGGLTLEHYRLLFTRLDIARNLLNSLLLASAVTVLSLAVNGAAGYAFAVLRFGGRERLFALLLAAMAVPAQVGMLPLFLLLKQLGMINSYLGVVIPGMASIFGIFLVRQHALSIPSSLLDAARVDGAGEFSVWWHIGLPLCRPMLVTLGAFTFLGTWNDFMWPLVVLGDAELHTLPVALANLAGEHVQDTELMMAGAVLAVAPVVVLFLALQRHYLAGLMSGAVKG